MTATLPPLPEASEANRIAFEDHWLTTRGGRKAKRELAHSPAKPDGYTCDSTQRHWWTWQCALSAIAAQAPASVQPELPPLPPELLEAINDCATLNYLNPAHQTETISALKNEIRDYARAAIAQPVQPTPLTDLAIPHLGATGKKRYDVDLDMWVAESCRQDEVNFARAIERLHGISAPVVPTLSQTPVAKDAA